MADALYSKGKENLLTGDIDWLSDDIKAVLVDTGAYTHNISTNEFLADISLGVVATSSNFSGKSATDGVADADDITFTSVTGPQCEAVVIYKDTGSAATSPLIAYIDSASGLPVTPSGGNIDVIWDSGSNKIFAI